MEKLNEYPFVSELGDISEWNMSKTWELPFFQLKFDVWKETGDERANIALEYRDFKGKKFDEIWIRKDDYKLLGACESTEEAREIVDKAIGNIEEKWHEGAVLSQDVNVGLVFKCIKAVLNEREEQIPREMTCIFNEKTVMGYLDWEKQQRDPLKNLGVFNFPGKDIKEAYIYFLYKGDKGNYVLAFKDGDEYNYCYFEKEFNQKSAKIFIDQFLEYKRDRTQSTEKENKYVLYLMDNINPNTYEKKYILKAEKGDEQYNRKIMEMSKKVNNNMLYYGYYDKSDIADEIKKKQKYAENMLRKKVIVICPKEVETKGIMTSYPDGKIDRGGRGR